MTVVLGIPENTGRVLILIRRMIDGGGLPADGRLPTERELAEGFGAGRRTVRRALEALEAEGLIWRRQGKGTFAGQRPDPSGTLLAELAPETDPLSVMEARLCIEPGLAELCARQARAEDVDSLRLLADHSIAATDPESSELWDGALHRLIARIAGNALLFTAYALFEEVPASASWQDKRLRARRTGNRRVYDKQHRAIIAAIAARDGPAARRAMTAHLTLHAQNLRKSLEKDAAR